MNKETGHKKDKPIETSLEFEDILESFLKVKPPEKKKPVKAEKVKQKPSRKTV